EYNRTLVKLNEEPVGSIVFKYRTAHRKFNDRIIWDRLKRESPVYNGDTIRTAEMSEAVITYRDNVTSVDLSENTLIQVFYDEKTGSYIDFFGGNIAVSSGSRGVVVSNGVSAIELEEGGQARVNGSAEGFGFSVLQGQARLDGEELRQGDIRAFQSNGTPDTGPVIAVRSPGTFARRIVSAGGAHSVDFTWNTANFSSDTRVIVETAEDREFKRIVESRDLSGVSSVSIPLESGNYWWRAYPSAGGSAEPAGGMYPTGRIEILQSGPAAALSPSAGEEFTFPGEINIPFSWSFTEDAAGYLLEISAEEDMANPAVSRRVQGASVVQGGLESGRWYWRVTPVFAEQAGDAAFSSEIREFSAARGESAPAAPALNFPARNGIMNLESPRLVWKYDPDVTSWTVEIADNQEMANPLVSRDVKTNFHILSPSVLQSGRTYYWRVTAENNGIKSPPSTVSLFTVENVGGQQAVFPPDNYSVAESELEGFRFSWKSNILLQQYFQVSSQSDFSILALNDPVEPGRSSHVVSSGPGPGTWYWRISAGELSSAPRSFNLVSDSEAPEITGGAESISRGGRFEIRWNDLRFNSYQVNVYDADNHPVDERIIKGNSASIPTSSLDPGNYIVSVRGFNPESARSARITGVSAETRFTLTAAEKSIPVVFVPPPLPPPVVEEAPPPPPLPPPVVEEAPPPVVKEAPPPPPPVQPVRDLARISGTGTVFGNFPSEGYILSRTQLVNTATVDFSWEGKAREYRFALYRADGEVIVQPVNTAFSVYTLVNPGRLEAGDYIWHVFEIDGQRRWEDYPSTATRFTVTEDPVERIIPTSDPGVLYGSR
ncbi:MAG: hypothetical protein LBD71_04875, partial [Treponema sp.]|nr:hypothetical protein [Treponema sp.]